MSNPVSARLMFKYVLVFLLLLPFIVIFNFGTNKPNPHVSVDEITSLGFYVYVLPDEVANELGWTRTIHTHFDEHCGLDWTVHGPKPLTIYYQNNSGESPLAILISPNSEDWNSLEETKVVALNSKWIPSGQGETYRKYVSDTYLLFKDKFGMEVLVSSSLEVDEVAKLIEQLRYVGADPNTIVNPWENAC